MSSISAPITASDFALAIADLPLSSLHAKAAELQNSIAHLRSSNSQLQPYAADGDADCADAIRENEDVIRRMEERIQLLRHEVEGRGMRWAEGESEDKAMRDAEGEMVNGVPPASLNRHADGEARTLNGGVRGRAQQSGRLTDEELGRMLRERMGESRDEEEEGMHL